MRGSRRRHDLFRGDMTIRKRRYDEVQAGESNAGRDLMARAPLELALHGLTVVVELAE